MRLFIAEKPDMGRKIAAALQGPHKNGNGFVETGEGVVTWCIGHIMESAKPEDYNPEWAKWRWENLPMIPQKWIINVASEKKKQFQIVKDLIKKADEIVNAGDPGREGQLIVDEVLAYLSNRKPTKRILLYALDKQSIRTALGKMEDNQKFFPLYQAGLGRGYADWLMGLNGTQAFTLLGQKKGYRGVLSVGRVQSPTLAIVVNRDHIIENFIPQDYFVLSGGFTHNNASKFKAYWRATPNTPNDWIDEEKRLNNKQAAYDLATKIKNKPAQVARFEQKDGKEFAPLPFSLSKLQMFASSKWGMTAQEVLDTCQSLYEKHELQTYPRTDCQYLPENQIGDAKEIMTHIAKSQPNLAVAVNGANLGLKSAAWNDKELGDHYGLIPTKKEADLSKLNDKEKKIYQAVCQRYIAQFYPPCLFKSAVVDIICEKEVFRANGKLITDPGWKKVFADIEDDKEENSKSDDEEDQVFPNIKVGDMLHCAESQVQEKKTKPPSRFTDGTLINAMSSIHTLVSDPAMKQKLKEKKGIGQEATRTQIIETLVKRGLIIRKGKQLISSPAGRALIKALPKRVVDPILTAMWEDALDKIAQNKLSLNDFLAKQTAWVQQLVDEAKKTDIDVSGLLESNPPSKGGAKSSGGAPKAPAQSTGEVCPKCKVGQLLKRGPTKSGKYFLGCNNYPKCDFTKWL